MWNEPNTYFYAVFVKCINRYKSDHVFIGGLGGLLSPLSTVFDGLSGIFLEGDTYPFLLNTLPTSDEDSLIKWPCLGSEQTVHQPMNR